MGKGKGKQDADIEAGKHYPSQMEDPQMRWGFIRKVYSILSLQLLLTTIIAGIVVVTPWINKFFHTRTGVILIYIIVIIAVIVSFLMFYYMERHPINIIMLGLFTVLYSLMVGALCVFYKGEVIVAASGLTLIIAFSLTLFTFWGAKRGYEFSFLGPFLFCALILVSLLSIILLFFPKESLGRLIVSFLMALIFCGFIIYDTNNLIKSCSYDEYIVGAIMLYIDIIQLFLHILRLMDD